MKYFGLGRHPPRTQIAITAALWGVFLLLINQDCSGNKLIQDDPAYQNSVYRKCLNRLPGHACSAFQQMGRVDYSLAYKVDQTFWKFYSLYGVPYANWHTFPNFAISDTGAVVQVADSSDSDFDAYPACVANFNAISKREGIRITEANVRDYIEFYLRATIPMMNLNELSPPISKVMVRRSKDAFPFTFIYDGRAASYKSGSKQSLKITAYGDGRVLSSNMVNRRHGGPCFSSDRMLNQYR